MFGQEKFATYVPKIKLRSNSIWIKHKPSETYPDQLRIGSEYDDQNTDEPSSVITQLPHMHAVRSLRSDLASIPLGCYVATELEPSSSETLIRH
ncbi:hypothetical protein F2Q68_00040312 [Brassica cretica]|uniref:Uncharacterized protein n=1 Tax=Brassica cretica TaxID=69181 RepID=A0A8S9MFD7_BRACR|nr:hypothetical protein F2Q68_00040312 [Brassica cretica]